MSDWIEDILALIDVVVSTGPIILVASSMGGWVATYVASIRRQRIKALVLIGKFLIKRVQEICSKGSVHPTVFVAFINKEIASV